MMQLESKPKYHYDKDFDSLTIFLDRSDNAFSEEVINNVYFVKDEDDDRLVSIEILYFMNRSLQNLQNVLPNNIYNFVKKLYDNDL